MVARREQPRRWDSGMFSGQALHLPRLRNASSGGGRKTTRIAGQGAKKRTTWLLFGTCEFSSFKTHTQTKPAMAHQASNTELPFGMMKTSQEGKTGSRVLRQSRPTPACPVTSSCMAIRPYYSKGITTRVAPRLPSKPWRHITIFIYQPGNFRKAPPPGRHPTRPALHCSLFSASPATALWTTVAPGAASGRVRHQGASKTSSLPRGHAIAGTARTSNGPGFAEQTVYTRGPPRKPHRQHTRKWSRTRRPRRFCMGSTQLLLRAPSTQNHPAHSTGVRSPDYCTTAVLRKKRCTRHGSSGPVNPLTFANWPRSTAVQD